MEAFWSHQQSLVADTLAAIDDERERPRSYLCQRSEGASPPCSARLLIGDSVDMLLQKPDGVMHHTKMLLQLVPVMRNLEEILELLPPGPHSGLFRSLPDIPRVKDLIQDAFGFPASGWRKALRTQV